MIGPAAARDRLARIALWLVVAAGILAGGALIGTFCSGCAAFSATPGLAGTVERLHAPLATWDACAANGRGFVLEIRVEAPKVSDIASRIAAGEAVSGGEIITYGCDGDGKGGPPQLDPATLRALLDAMKRNAATAEGASP